jgi:hypothetical protein
LRIHIYFTLKPAHISFKALILPNCIVIITKTTRSLDALSLLKFRSKRQERGVKKGWKGLLYPPHPEYSH